MNAVRARLKGPRSWAARTRLLLGVTAAGVALAAAGTAVAAGTPDAGTPSPAEAAARAGLWTDVPGHQEACQGPAVVCRGRIMFGLATPDVLDLNPTLTGLESRLGHRADLIGSYQDFTEPMYTARLRAAIASGRTPVVTWEPYNSKRYATNTYPLRSIAAGAYDAYLRRSADQARAVGAPFVVRFGHEMNGFWYPWGQPRVHPQNVAAAGNTPAMYAAAYRHVVDVFRQRGATNVAWMWSPNVTDANPAVTLRSLYPGDQYVDVIGLSGYLERPTDTVESRYRDTLDELSALGPGKPVVIAETGAVVAEHRGPQLTAMIAALSAEPRISGIIYFSQPDKAVDYRISDDVEAQDALRSALQSPRFTRPVSTGSAFARTPQVTGEAIVGQSLSTQWTWRGTPTQEHGLWLSCPEAATPSEQCDIVGRGSALSVGMSLHGRYLRAALGIMSAGASDYAESRTTGPVRVRPAAVTVSGIDLLSTAVRVRFPAAEAGTTNWVVKLDDAAAEYLPASTTTEHYYNNLPAGSTHTLTVAASDGPSVGPATTLTFGVVTKPQNPAFSTGHGTYTVTLPAPAPGQTGWVAVSDGVETALPLGTTSVTRSGLTPGQHTFGLRAVAGDGRTNPATVFPTVS